MAHGTSGKRTSPVYFPFGTASDEQKHKGLNVLGEEVQLERKIVVCGEKVRRRADDSAEIMAPAVFFEELWGGALIG